MLEQRPADIVLADWLMPEMGDLELTSAIRQLDESLNRYTYVLLLTAKEGVDALAKAFDEGVDDFVQKAEMDIQLIPLLLSAERLVNNQNRLLAENNLLVNANTNLKKLITIDKLTGLGNRQHAMRRLTATLKHVDARDVVVCLTLLTVDNIAELEKKHSVVVKTPSLAWADAYANLVRPLDSVTRISTNQVAVIAHLPDTKGCASFYQRIHESINHKAYKTAMGFVSVSALTSVTIVDNQNRLPSPEQLVQLASGNIARAKTDNGLAVSHWKATETVQSTRKTNRFINTKPSSPSIRYEFNPANKQGHTRICHPFILQAM